VPCSPSGTLTRIFVSQLAICRSVCLQGTMLSAQLHLLTGLTCVQVAAEKGRLHAELALEKGSSTGTLEALQAQHREELLELCAEVDQPRAIASGQAQMANHLEAEASLTVNVHGQVTVAIQSATQSAAAAESQCTAAAAAAAAAASAEAALNEQKVRYGRKWCAAHTHVP
jgi:hypothetical protein